MTCIAIHFIWPVMTNQLFSLRKLPCNLEVRGLCVQGDAVHPG
jgi:hypothetical protein